MKNIIILLCACIVSLGAFAQKGEIRGTILSADSIETVPFATVVAMRDSIIILATSSDLVGNYSLKNLAAGTYSVKVISIGYQNKVVKNIRVVANRFTIANIKLIKASHSNEIIVTEYRIPLIDKASPATQKTMSYEDIQSAPVREVAGLSFFKRKAPKKQDPNIRGSRSDATTYYVDGVKVRGVNSIAPSVKDESYDKITENTYFDAAHHPLSTFSIDVDAASYSNIRRFINGGTFPPADAVRIEEMINYFSYNYPSPIENKPFSINTEVSTCPWNTNHRLIQVGLKGKVIATENLPDNNIVFLIDVSGSMDEPNKLPLLKQSFHLLVEQLRSQDRVAIVVYAGNAGLVLPSTRGNEKEKILAAIDALDAGGSTAGGAGIELAYKIAKENFMKSGNNRVILATDGDFNVGVSGDEELVKLIENKREEGIFLTVLGFGVGNYKDSKMEKLADKGNGNFAYIDNILEANKVFVREMGATLVTIAKDVKLQIEFNPALVKGYRLIGYENRVLEDRDFNDDKKDAGEMGCGRTVTALYEIIPAGSEEMPDHIDSLKYQANKPASYTGSNELMTVKFRYKEPGGSQSKLISHALVDENIAFANTTGDFRFQAAVAEFGMILRNSQYKGSAGFDHVLTLARESKGADNEGYRAEFIRLVETAQLLYKGTAQIASPTR